eukprot:6640880-Pyramimonas_sp.AAC.1
MRTTPPEHCNQLCQWLTAARECTGSLAQGRNALTTSASSARPLRSRSRSKPTFCTMAPQVKRSLAASEIPTVPARGYPRPPFEGSIVRKSNQSCIQTTRDVDTQAAQDATTRAGEPYVGMLPEQICNGGLRGRHETHC